MFAQLIRGRSVFLQRPLLFLFEFRQPCANVFHVSQLLHYRLLVRVQLLRLHPVLAGHIVQLLQALFHFVQTLGVLVQPAWVRPQFVGRLGNVHGRILQQCVDAGQSGIKALKGRQFLFHGIDAVVYRLLAAV